MNISLQDHEGKESIAQLYKQNGYMSDCGHHRYLFLSRFLLPKIYFFFCLVRFSKVSLLKGKYKQGEKTAFWMGENNSNWNNWQTTNLKNIQATSVSRFLKFPFWCLQWHIGCLVTYGLANICLHLFTYFCSFFLVVDSSLISLWLEKMFGSIPILNLLRLVL